MLSANIYDWRVKVGYSCLSENVEALAAQAVENFSAAHEASAAPRVAVEESTVDADAKSAAVQILHLLSLPLNPDSLSEKSRWLINLRCVNQYWFM